MGDCRNTIPHFILEGSMIDNDKKETFKVYVCENGHINYIPLLQKVYECKECGMKCKFQQTFVDLPKVVTK